MPSPSSQSSASASRADKSSQGGARLKGKSRQRRSEWLLLPVGIAASVALGWGTVRALHGSHGYTFWRAKVQHDNDRLAALQSQLEEQQHLLTTLKGPNGRDIVLHGHGYIRPGERILLFPQAQPAPINAQTDDS